jgi:uncharacterized membrane protein YsdA (DUF1294 family)
MTITFATILFALFFLFKGLQKNIFFLLYAGAMILTAYWCENYLGWKVHLFGKTSLLLFILFHFPFVNLFTFWAYGRDKRLAQRQEWRIPEVQLHTLELLGGTIGAIAGQKFFHHKNKKKSYMATFFATIFIQVGIMVFILFYLKIL